MLKALFFRSIVLALVLVSSTALSAAEFDVDSLQDKIYSTIESVQPAVVSLGRRGTAFSGVIVSKEGHILSAGHAVRPGERYRVLLPDGRRLVALGKGSNPQVDCALLKITTKVDDLPYVRMGESKSLVRNQPCISISFPGGQGTRGVPVVRFGRLIRNSQRRGTLQSTAVMEPGDSGGPLFDLDGRVIGIHSRIGRSMDHNYEISVDTFKTYWNELNREEYFTQSGPPTPRLGFRGRGRSDGTGVNVSQIVDDSLADKHGLETDDVIQAISGQPTPSIAAVRQLLIAARDDGTQEITVKILRGEESIDLNVPFDVERNAAPDVELPQYDDKEFSNPQAISQLVNLPRHFSDLESVLDDTCVKISSTLSDGESISIVGTRIKESPLIVSKSSMVGEHPTIRQDDGQLTLEIVSRDVESDLVLLKSPLQNSTGIDLNAEVNDIPSVGSFLITPDSRGKGWISVVSTKTFRSRKQQSRGFLGVIPANYKDKGGVILEEVTEDGAAKRAGLKIGDVVTKLNETEITTRLELRRFLSKLDPNATVIATIARDDDELQKTIRLGSMPSRSNHAADQMKKSGRRDGFSEVIPHDANLKPRDCGGPIFDLDGNFLGLNIARNSRVRSYAIPHAIVKKLVDSN